MVIALDRRLRLIELGIDPGIIKIHPDDILDSNIEQLIELGYEAQLMNYHEIELDVLKGYGAKAKLIYKLLCADIAPNVRSFLSSSEAFAVPKGDNDISDHWERLILIERLLQYACCSPTILPFEATLRMSSLGATITEQNA